MISATRISEAAKAATVHPRFYDDFNIEIGATLVHLRQDLGVGSGTALGGKMSSCWLKRPQRLL